jgi:hypothetical protein
MKSGTDIERHKKRRAARWWSIAFFGIGFLGLMRVALSSLPLDAYYFTGGRNPKDAAMTGWQILLCSILCCTGGVIGYFRARREKDA